ARNRTSWYFPYESARKTSGLRADSFYGYHAGLRSVEAQAAPALQREPLDSLSLSCVSIPR
ncbi:MAG: hypothetical protein ABIA59_00200, partial [Candidatus Latescibacterota bacterium]